MPPPLTSSASTPTAGVETRIFSRLATQIWPTCSIHRPSPFSLVTTILPTFANVSDNKQYSEYGCNKVQPRVFTEVGALYGTEMTALSGGLVYEYTQEEQDYGLVVVNANGTISLKTDFDNLQTQYNRLDRDLLQTTNPASTNIKPPSCAPSLITAEQFSKNFTIPAVCPGCQALIDNGISNPNNGKLVDVSATKPKMEVYGSNGQTVQGLELKKLTGDGVNGPGGQTTTPSGSGTAPQQPAESKKGAAAQLKAGALVWIVFAALLI